jgi:hypothetical protein
MTQRESRTDQPGADTQQSEHERKVAEIEKARGELYADRDAAEEPGRRPTSDADLAADRGRGDDDVVGDDQSSPGQNSDRLPQ